MIRKEKGCVITMPNENVSPITQSDEKHASMAAKIGVVGDKDSILCFKAFGLDVYPALESEPAESRKIIDNLARNQYGVIFVTEQIARTVTETIDRYNREMLPAIILIPGSQGSLGIGLERIQSNVERAVGINILDEGR